MHLLFDLDGTLTDPGVGITRCIQHALETLGRPVPPAAALRQYVGPPLRETLAALLGVDDAIVVEQALGHYRECYAPVGMFENEVYPGVREALPQLAAAGHRLWVATGKPHVYAREILSHFGLADAFAGVHGSELSGANCDKGELIAHVLRTEGIAAGEAWMIGDRMYDIRGAHRNGVAAVGVLWG